MPGDVLTGSMPIIPSQSSAVSIGSGSLGHLPGHHIKPDVDTLDPSSSMDSVMENIIAEEDAKKDEAEHNSFYDEFGIDISNLSEEDQQLIEQLYEYYQKYKDSGDSAWYEKLFETIYNLQSTSSARKWEEEMSNTAFSRLVADIKRAGYNPWIALQSGYGQASTPSVSAAQSSNVSKSEQDTQKYAAKLNFIGQIINGLFRMIGGIV